MVYRDSREGMMTLEAGVEVSEPIPASETG